MILEETRSTIIQEWMQNDIFDKKTQEETKKLSIETPKLLQDAFYQDLAFGTGGMRGKMGIGTNRINAYTLGKVTQALSQYLKNNFTNQKIRTVIAYDCRHQSDTLAKIVADVFSANGIEVYLFSALRPTPELSFAVKTLKCQCGIVLTASHNPPQYNGYKVYWQDGGQLVPPQDQEIIQQVNQTDYSDILFKSNTELIHLIDDEIDEKFHQASVVNANFASQEARENTTIAFTSLHGTSITAIPQVLKKAGYTNVHIVEDQAKPDGNFPTVKSPNPEEIEALDKVLHLGQETQADIAIGTDPDCDRLGIAVRNLKGDLELLNGNQTMIVLTEFLLQQYQNKGFEGNEFIASTIVSTPMLAKIAKHYKVHYKEVLTGFKWIAKLIEDFPELKFLGGGEESYGYMVGDFVRDKDAVTATLLACEIVAYTKTQGSSFYEMLLEAYQKYGLYKEHLTSLVKEGQKGNQEIQQIMIDFRDNPPKELSGEKITSIEDYLHSKKLNTSNNEHTVLTLPKANVLIFHTEKGSKIAVRPSGTEPKIKFYISIQDKLDKISNFDNKTKELNQRIKDIAKALGIS